MIKRTIFLGTPEFAVKPLEKLIDSKYTPILIVSQPDRPRGRNLRTEHTPTKKIALQHNIRCYQPEDINAPESIKYIKSFEPDILIVVAYGTMINKELRTFCPFGAINLHPSLLPRHRGADPIRSTILSEDKTCGNSIFFVSAKMDSGQIILQKEYLRDQNENFTQLQNTLNQRGAHDLIEAIEILEKNDKRYHSLKQTFQKQEHQNATYSTKINSEAYRANFHLPTNKFITKIKAYSHSPGYYCSLRGKKLKLLNAQKYSNVSQETSGKITQIIKNIGFTIALPDGEILITETQYAGRQPMKAWEFALGARLNIGEILENTTPQDHAGT